MVSGILFVDKSNGPTSHAVVASARRALNTRKVGHAGTLDPMATGLLTLGVGTSTRLLTFLVGLDKQYTATIRLGSATHTDDREGDVVFVADGEVLSALTDDAIDAEVSTLTGVIQQRPSSVSAIRIDGRRAHDMVRDGIDVVIPEREVTISRFDVVQRRRSDAWIELDVVVDCSSGTYIRALARDLGEALHVGGHLTELRRTRVGPFTVDEAVSQDEISVPHLHTAAEVAARLFPTVSLTEQQSIDVVHGKKLSIDLPDTPRLCALAPDGILIALLEVRNGVARVEIGFPRD